MTMLPKNLKIEGIPKTCPVCEVPYEIQLGYDRQVSSCPDCGGTLTYLFGSPRQGCDRGI